jgi:hypothetical protein
MHRRSDFFWFWPLLALMLASAASTAHAVPVVRSLYGTVVADPDPRYALQDARREVLLRLTDALASNQLRAAGADAQGVPVYRYRPGP